MQRVFLHQILFDRERTGVVEVLLASRGIGLKGVDDLGLALIEGLFASLLDVKVDEFLVIGWRAVTLNLRIVKAGPVHSRTQGIVVRLV